MKLLDEVQTYVYLSPSNTGFVRNSDFYTRLLYLISGLSVTGWSGKSITRDLQRPIAFRYSVYRLLSALIQRVELTIRASNACFIIFLMW